MKKRRSSRAKNTNLLKLVEAGVIGSVITRNMMGTSLRNFVTNENPSDGVTFMELLKGSPNTVTRTQYGTNVNIGSSAQANMDMVWANTKANAVPLVVGMISVPIMFRFGKKFARPVLTPSRGLLKGSGVTV